MQSRNRPHRATTNSNAARTAMSERKSPQERQAEVYTACEQIKSQGRKITVAAVIELIGGSNTSALRYIQQWKASDASTETGVDPLLSRAYEQMKTGIQKTFDEKLAKAETARKEAEKRAHEAETRAKRAETEAAESRQKAQHAEQKLIRAEESVRLAQERAETAEYHQQKNHRSTLRLTESLQAAIAEIKTTIGQENTAHQTALSHIRDIKDVQSGINHHIDELPSKIESQTAARLTTAVGDILQAAERHSRDLRELQKEVAKNQAAVAEHKKLLSEQAKTLPGLIQQHAAVEQKLATESILTAIEPITETLEETLRRLSDVEKAIQKSRQAKTPRAKSASKKTS